jgi:hypothetical protein
MSSQAPRSTAAVVSSNPNGAASSSSGVQTSARTSDPWTGISRNLQREAVCGIDPHFQWQAGSSKIQWRSFEEPWQSQLREDYLNRYYNSWIGWDVNGRETTMINFTAMQQRNEQTGVLRNIRIRPPE